MHAVPRKAVALSHVQRTRQLPSAEFTMDGQPREPVVRSVRAGWRARLGATLNTTRQVMLGAALASSLVSLLAQPACAEQATTIPASSATSTAAVTPANTGAAATHAPLSLDTLMQSFARRKSGEAHFTELKYLSNLRGPVESSGTLAFRAPDHFEQQTVKPRAQSLVVDGDSVTMSRDGHQRVVSLAQYPEIGTLVNSIRGTLTGDRASLERSYKLTLDGASDNWRLNLTPADASLTKSIDHIVVSGGQDGSGNALIRTIETFQTDGDRSVMTIEPDPS